MYVRMRKSVGTADGTHRTGHVYDVADTIGAEWIRRELATESAEPPPHVAELLARLDDGAGRPCLFLPFVGEFGHLVMTHIRIVHWHRASRKVVCCRPGDQVLYPSADQFVTDWNHPVPDAQRIATMRDDVFEWPAIAAAFPGLHQVKSGRLTPRQELVTIAPGERIPFRPHRRGLQADVVLGTRRRDNGPARNWQHWQELADAIAAAGYTFAVIGHPESSFGLRGQVAYSGDYDTDAAVELLQSCRFYVGTDSGGSHLAAAVGAPMLVFRQGRDDSRDLTGRMMQANSDLTRLPNAWDRPDRVIRAVIDRLGVVR